jgi:hypothetical protein
MDSLVRLFYRGTLFAKGKDYETRRENQILLKTPLLRLDYCPRGLRPVWHPPLPLPVAAVFSTATRGRGRTCPRPGTEGIGLCSGLPVVC